MSTLKPSDQFHRLQIAQTRVHFLCLFASISDDELSYNCKLARTVGHILKQLDLIDELNLSFEF